jgi:ribosomal protein L11 methyltransferase
LSGWKTWRVFPASQRLAREQELEPLSEFGFIVTSHEVSRDGPWRIEIFGQGDKARVAAATDGQWQWEELPDIDWVAENQRSFKPFAVGPFWIHPSHARDRRPSGLIAIEIDAGMAFGTGTHATTRGCLEMLATLHPEDVSMAVDVGCGSGILAIAMAKLWCPVVFGGDNDAQAVEVARRNAQINQVSVDFVTSAGLLAPELARVASYDLIVANILAGPLAELSQSFAAAIRPGGRVLLSGLLVEQADMILSSYKRRGFTLERHIDLETGGAWWRTLLLRHTSRPPPSSGEVSR